MSPASVTKQQVDAGDSKKRRDQFLAVFLGHIKACNIGPNEKLLVIGGTWQDVDLLARAGFKDITLSNFQSHLKKDASSDLSAKVKLLALHAEHIDLPNGSLYARTDLAGASFPYELFSVVHHGHEAGGVRGSCIPNFIYRWNANEVRKTVSSYLAEQVFAVHACPYWDFNVDEEELSMRRETRIHAITSIVGARTFIATLKTLQIAFSAIPGLRRQGNKFFCCIEKSGELRPWLTARGGKAA